MARSPSSPGGLVQRCSASPAAPPWSTAAPDHPNCGGKGPGSPWPDSRALPLAVPLSSANQTLRHQPLGTQRALPAGQRFAGFCSYTCTRWVMGSRGCRGLPCPVCLALPPGFLPSQLPSPTLCHPQAAAKPLSSLALTGHHPILEPLPSPVSQEMALLC